MHATSPALPLHGPENKHDVTATFCVHFPHVTQIVSFL